MHLKSNRIIHLIGCRSVAFATALCLALSGLAIPAHASPEISSSSIPQKLIPADIHQIKIPNGIGKIEEVYKGQNSKLVILIKDAHAIPDAQSNIARLISHFQNEYDISEVFVEGAASKFDPQIFRSFPDKNKLKKVFDEFQKNGELTGSTEAAIFSDVEGQYEGIENWKLYEEGVYFYLLAMKSAPELSKVLEIQSRKLENKKKRIYSQVLLELDSSLELFHKNQIGLIDVLRKLSRIHEPEAGTELSILFDEGNRSRVDVPAIEMEVNRFSSEVEKSLKADKQKTNAQNKLEIFNQKLQEFKTSQRSLESFAFYLKKVIHQNHMPIKISSELLDLAAREKRLGEIEGTKLFRDFEDYASGVKESLFKTDEEHRLDQETNQLRLFKKLSKLELSAEDWLEMKKLKIGGQLQILFDSHFNFYRNAEKRNEAFIKNLKQSMNRAHSNSAILISGGFHTQSVSAQLKKMGCSYVVVFPQINTLPKTSFYQNHMKGDVSWKNYLKAEHGKLDIHSAFIRAVRDRLMMPVTTSERSKRSNDERVLKLWRDQIIRDLSAKGKITEASRYTRLIDEALPKNHQDSVFELGLKHVSQFIQGFKKLEATNQVNQTNIFQLLKAGTILDLLANNSLVPGAIQLNQIGYEGGKFIAAHLDAQNKTQIRSDVQNRLNQRSEAREEKQSHPEMRSAVNIWGANTAALGFMNRIWQSLFGNKSKSPPSNKFWDSSEPFMDPLLEGEGELSKMFRHILNTNPSQASQKLRNVVREVGKRLEEQLKEIYGIQVSVAATARGSALKGYARLPESRFASTENSDLEMAFIFFGIPDAHDFERKYSIRTRFKSLVLQVLDEAKIRVLPEFSPSLTYSIYSDELLKKVRFADRSSWERFNSTVSSPLFSEYAYPEYHIAALFTPSLYVGNQDDLMQLRKAVIQKIHEEKINRQFHAEELKRWENIWHNVQKKWDSDVNYAKENKGRALPEGRAQLNLPDLDEITKELSPTGRSGLRHEKRTEVVSYSELRKTNSPDQETNQLNHQEVNQKRLDLVQSGQRYVDFLSDGDNISKTSPDAFHLIGNPDLRSILEFTKTWKEIKRVYQREIPIVLVGGIGRGTLPLLTSFLLHYQNVLDSAEKARFEAFLEPLKRYLLEGGEPPKILETDILRLILEKERISPTVNLVFQEPVPSRNTAANFENATEIFEALSKGQDNFTIALVSSPPLLFRLAATAEKKWAEQVKRGWAIKKFKTYDVELRDLSDADLITRIGYLAGFPTKYVAQYPQLSPFGELNAWLSGGAKDVAPREIDISTRLVFTEAQQAFERFLDSQTLQLDPILKTLVPIHSELRVSKFPQNQKTSGYYEAHRTDLKWFFATGFLIPHLSYFDGYAVLRRLKLAFANFNLDYALGYFFKRTQALVKYFEVVFGGNRWKGLLHKGETLLQMRDIDFKSFNSLFNSLNPAANIKKSLAKHQELRPQVFQDYSKFSVARKLRSLWINRSNHSQSPQIKNISSKTLTVNINFIHNFMQKNHNSENSKPANGGKLQIFHPELRQSVNREANAIGVMGLGRQGQRLLEALLNSSEERLNVHAATINHFDEMQSRFGQNPSLNLKKEESKILFTDPNTQAVVIATPAGTHYELVKQALQNGKHVFVEKPFTLNEAEAHGLVWLARRRNLVLMVGHQLLYSPVFQKLKEVIHRPQFGEIESIKLNLLNPFRAGRDWTSSVLEDLGTHNLYMAADLLEGRAPPEILKVESSEDEMTMHLELKYGNIPVTINMSRNHPGKTQQRTVKVIGKEFVATFDHSKEIFELTVKPHVEKFNSEHLAELNQIAQPSASQINPLKIELKAFLDSIRNRTQSPSSGQAAAEIVRTIEKIKQFYFDEQSKKYESVLDELMQEIYPNSGENTDEKWKRISALTTHHRLPLQPLPDLKLFHLVFFTLFELSNNDILEKVLTRISTVFFPILKKLENAYVRALPTLENWLIYPITFFINPYYYLISTKRFLNRVTPLEAAIRYALFGSHLRTISELTNDHSDFELMPDYLNKILPRLNELFDLKDTLPDQMKEREMLSRAVINGLIFYNYRTSVQNFYGEPGYLGFLEKKILNPLSKAKIFPQDPEEILLKALHETFKNGWPNTALDMPAYLCYSQEAASNLVIEEVVAYNQTHPNTSLSLLQVVAGQNEADDFFKWTKTGQEKKYPGQAQKSFEVLNLLKGHLESLSALKKSQVSSESSHPELRRENQTVLLALEPPADVKKAWGENHTSTQNTTSVPVLVNSEREQSQLHPELRSVDQGFGNGIDTHEQISVFDRTQLKVQLEQILDESRNEHHKVQNLFHKAGKFLNRNFGSAQDRAQRTRFYGFGAMNGDNRSPAQIDLMSQNRMAATLSEQDKTSFLKSANNSLARDLWKMGHQAAIFFRNTRDLILERVRLSSFSDQRYNRIAFLMLLSASFLFSPWLAHPGSSGTYTLKLLSDSFSNMTVYFILTLTWVGFLIDHLIYNMPSNMRQTFVTSKGARIFSNMPKGFQVVRNELREKPRLLLAPEPREDIKQAWEEYRAQMFRTKDMSLEDVKERLNQLMESVFDEVAQKEKWDVNLSQSEKWRRLNYEFNNRLDREPLTLEDSGFENMPIKEWVTLKLGLFSALLVKGQATLFPETENLDCKEFPPRFKKIRDEVENNILPAFRHHKIGLAFALPTFGNWLSLMSMQRMKDDDDYVEEINRLSKLSTPLEAAEVFGRFGPHLRINHDSTDSVDHKAMILLVKKISSYFIALHHANPEEQLVELLMSRLLVSGRIFPKPKLDGNSGVHITFQVLTKQSQFSRLLRSLWRTSRSLAMKAWAALHQVVGARSSEDTSQEGFLRKLEGEGIPNAVEVFHKAFQTVDAENQSALAGQHGFSHSINKLPLYLSQRYGHLTFLTASTLVYYNEQGLEQNEINENQFQPVSMLDLFTGHPSSQHFRASGGLIYSDTLEIYNALGKALKKRESLLSMKRSNAELHSPHSELWSEPNQYSETRLVVNGVFNYLMSGKQNSEEALELSHQVALLPARDVIETLEQLRSKVEQDAIDLEHSGNSLESFGAKEFATEVENLIQRLKNIQGKYALGFVIPAQTDLSQMETALEPIVHLGFKQVFLGGARDRIGFNQLFQSNGVAVNNGGIKRAPIFLDGHQKEAVVIVLNQDDLRGIQVNPAFVPFVITDLDKIQNPFARDCAIIFQAAVAFLTAYEGKAALLKNPILLLEKYGLISSDYQNAMVYFNGQELSMSATAFEAYLKWKSTRKLKIAA